MNTIRKSGYLALFAAIQLLTTDAFAVSLGRLKGTALLGQPLEVVASLQFSGDEPPTADCLEATVVYGSNQLSSSQVAVTVLPSASGQIVPVLISTSANVDEPVVTVTLTAGCLQKASRRYLLLSELVSEPLPGAPAAGFQREVKASEPTNAPAAIEPKATLRKPAAASSSVSSTSALEAKTVPKPPKTRKQSKKRLPAAEPAQGVLKLSPSAKQTDTPPNRSGITASDLASIEELTRRVEAIAEWKAANEKAPAEKSNDETIAALQQSLKVLQTVTSKNTRDLQAVASAVEASQSRNGGWIYGVAGLAILTLVLAGWAAMRSRRDGEEPGPWWGATQADENLMEPATVHERVKAEGPKEDTLMSDATHQDVASSSLAHDLALPNSATASASAASQKPSEIKRTDKRDFAHSASASLRAVNTKEMFDERQQAEFFMALGQHDEAIKVLERSNLESEESNPLVLLDLLRILHTLSRRADFDRHRAEFNLLFTGIVPEYGDFLDEGNSLDSYPDIIRQLQDLWPSDDAMDYLEQCMVRTPEDEVTQGFDIEAFRDLLMLHAMLRRLDTEELASDLAPFSANRTMTSGLAAEGDPVPDADADADADSDQVPLPVLPSEATPVEADAAVDLELDLDLTEKPAANLIDFDANGLGTFNKPKA